MPSIADKTDEALRLYRARKFDEAWPLLCEMLRAKPDHTQARELLLATALQTARHAEALPIFQEAADARRSIPELQEAVAILLMKRPDGAREAEKHVRRALAIRPGRAPALVLLGAALGDQGKIKESQDALKQACQIDPKSVLAWFNLGMNLQISEKHEEAVRAFRTATSLSPRDAVAWTALGKSLHRADHMVESLRVLEKSLAMAPEHAFGLSALGNALIAVGQCERGCELLERAIRADPTSRDVRAVRMMGLNYVCDQGEVLLAEHRAFGERLEAEIAPIDPPQGGSAPGRRDGRRLRVGFLSADMREHSCSRFLLPLIEGLSKPDSEMEVFGLYNSMREDSITARFKAAMINSGGGGGGWLSVAGKKTEEAAAAIRELDLDVIVECSGVTDGNRLDICAARPAPVQMTFLGYPNTTGLSRIDYRLVDAITDPAPTADAFAIEKLLRIPECLWCFRSAEGAPEVGPSPAEAGGGGRVTIGCFNNLSKISPQVIATYAEVLRRAPRATLLFKNRRVEEAETLAWLRTQFEDLGVRPDQIDAVGWIPNPADHLKVYDRIDFQLDTFPYNGTTTTCESFWQGVPIVAVKGKVHAARVSMSLLHAIGLDELVADDLPGYIEIAVALANDPSRLGNLRREMRERMAASPLRDEKGYCERFAVILRQAATASANRA